MSITLTKAERIAIGDAAEGILDRIRQEDTEQGDSPTMGLLQENEEAQALEAQLFEAVMAIARMPDEEDRINRVEQFGDLLTPLQVVCIEVAYTLGFEVGQRAAGIRR